MYEHRKHKMLSRRDFALRVAGHVAIAVAIMLSVLVIGILGYHFLAELEWIDALVDASMILGGMGPVNPLATPLAKVWASLYALFCGLVAIGVASLLVAPFAHRLLHRLHMDDERRA